MLVLLAALLPSAGDSQEPAKIEFAAGPREGTYWKVADRVRRNNPDLDLQVLETEGSDDNLERFRSDDVRFAFVQLDVLAGEGNTKEPAFDLAIAGAVFVEYLHILVRYPLEIDSMRSLSGMTVWRGAGKSGTRHTTDLLFDITGISPRGVVEIDSRLSLSDLDKELRSRNLDVVFQVATRCQEPIRKILEARLASLVPLDPATLRRVEDHETILVESIDASVYPRQSEQIRTIAVPAMLVVRGDEPNDDLVRRLLIQARRAWLEVAAELGGAEPVGDSCTEPSIEDLDPKLARLDLAYHPAVERPSGIDSKRVAAWIFLGILILVGARAFAIWTRRTKWYSNVRLDRFAVIALMALLVSILSITVLTYLFERAINPNFSTLPESLWSITIYLFSGLEDRNPYTPQGRFTAALGLLLGPLFFAAMTGWLANYLFKWEKSMPRNLADHYLILNWSVRAIDLVREIQNPIITNQKGKAVVVVLTSDDELSVKDLKEAGSGRQEIFEDFYLSVGDPADERALLNANAQDTKTIIILADDKAGPHADEATIRSIIMLRRIAHACDRKNLHVVAELVNSANETVIDEIAKDFPGLLERVSGLQIRNCLLAQAALNEGIVEFYVDLLRVTGDTNEVYVEPIPDSAVGMTFRDYGTQVLNVESDNPMIPVGVQRRDTDGRSRLFCNPRFDSAVAILQKGDGIVLLAYEPVDTRCLPNPGSGSSINRDKP